MLRVSAINFAKIYKFRHILFTKSRLHTDRHTDTTEYMISRRSIRLRADKNLKMYRKPAKAAEWVPDCQQLWRERSYIYDTLTPYSANRIRPLNVFGTVCDIEYRDRMESAAWRRHSSSTT